MYIIHPFQNVYFNFFAGENIHKKYDVDYWGVGNRDFLQKILITEKDKHKIYIGVASFTSLWASEIIIDKKYRDTLNPVGQDYQQADYIFTNFMSEVNRNIDKKYDIPANFKLFYSFNVNNTKVYDVYKKH